MKVMKEVKSKPELSPIIAERRYVWRYIGSYMKAKHDQVLSRFWTERMPSLNDFDQNFPNHYRTGPPPPGRLLLTQEPAQVIKATGSYHPPTMPERAESPPLPYVNIFATTPDAGLSSSSTLLPHAGPFKSAFPAAGTGFLPAAGSSKKSMPNAESFPAAGSQSSGFLNAGSFLAAGSQSSGFLPYAGASSTFQAAGLSQASGITTDAGARFTAAGSSQTPIIVDAGSSTLTPGAGGKSLVPDTDAGDAGFVPDAEGGDEDAEGIEDETMVPEKGDKKGKKRPEPVPSGIFRIPMCLRCTRARNQTCEEQTGGSTACYRCAKLKMKCGAPPKQNDAPGPASNQPPPAPHVEAPAPKAPKTITKKPAAKGKAVKKTPAEKTKPAEKAKTADKTIKSKPAQAPVPTPSTSNPAQVPAPTPSTSKPARAPAPTPSTSKKRKVIKSPETVESGGSEDEDEMDWKHWPEHRRTFLEFETYYGSFLFFIFITILIDISRYSSLQVRV
jgi:hypothetical protein